MAAGETDTPQSSAALEELCRTYWYPLYVYIRRRGYGHEDAQDLTQGFLLQLLQRRSFARVDQKKGLFRSFLLAGLNYFLIDQKIRETAQKRGGGATVLSFDAQTADQRYRLEPAEELSPDKVFERQWALALLDKVLERLKREFRDTGKGELFERLRVFLVAGTARETYAPAASDLAMTPDAVKKAVHRMRSRYQELFREEIAHTVAEPAQLDDEMRHLCAVLGG